MEFEKRDAMIAELAQITPRYAYNCKEFDPEKSPVYYSGPYWDHKELEYAMKALLTGKWLVSGEYVQRFQNGFAEKFGVRFAHMVNSGSSANLTMIAGLKKHLGWKDGDEVIVSPVGFPTTIAPLVQNGLKPVFVDIEMNTLNFDLQKVTEKINDRTVAIFVSPVLGNPPNLKYLSQLAEVRKIKLIGDNCDSIGSRYNGEHINKYYYAWSCSFYPAHHISTGEGGMVCSDDGELIDQVRSISWWGRDCHCVGSSNLLSCGTCGNRFDKWLEGYNGIIDHKYFFTNMGYNLKPLDLQGAIGLAQLEKFDDIDLYRRVNFEKFKNLILKYIPGVRIAETVMGSDPCWFGVPIICQNQEQKEKFVAFLEANRIQTRNYFAGNILLHPAYKHLDDASKYPNSNLALSHVFFVGCPPHYTEVVFSYIEEVLQKWI
jgi:CDP-4-dehydro-6-deoxyglucose reductase, E1